MEEEWPDGEEEYDEEEGASAWGSGHWVTGSNNTQAWVVKSPPPAAPAAAEAAVAKEPSLVAAIATAVAAEVAAQASGQTAVATAVTAALSAQVAGQTAIVVGAQAPSAEAASSSDTAQDIRVLELELKLESLKRRRSS
jgi:hypothetical protein